MPAPRPSLPSTVIAIVRVVVLEALRGRVAWLVALAIAVGFALAAFSSRIAITESREIAAAVLGAWLRLASVFVVALFVGTSVLRDQADKGMELVLSLPLPRGAWLAGRLAGYSVVAVATAAACTALVLTQAPASAALVWGITLACELLLVSALATLCLLTLRHAPVGLGAVFAFYLLARSMDAIRLMAANPLAAGEGAAGEWIARVLDLIAFLLPDLHRFARSEWLVAGHAGPGDLWWPLAQWAIYLPLLVAAALFDLERKVP